MTLPVRTTPEADQQIGEIDRRWHTNRPAAPDLFESELNAAFDLLADAPQIGRPYSRSPTSGTRRILFKGTRYHVYYVPRSEVVYVLTVWHARRGVGPPLRVA